jgi:hypothetical protein
MFHLMLCDCDIWKLHLLPLRPPVAQA